MKPEEALKITMKAAAEIKIIETKFVQEILIPSLYDDIKSNALNGKDYLFVGFRRNEQSKQKLVKQHFNKLGYRVSDTGGFDYDICITWGKSWWSTLIYELFTRPISHPFIG